MPENEVNGHNSFQGQNSFYVACKNYISNSSALTC